MFSSAYRLISPRIFLISSLLLLNIFISFMYMSGKKSIFPCAERAQTQDSNNNNRSTELHVNPQTSDTQKIQAAAVDTESDIIVLVWTWPFDIRFSFSCDIFNIAGCHVTKNRTLLPKAHGVLMHHLELKSRDMPKEPRPYFQKWVWFNMEPPVKIHVKPEIKDMFNLTCTFRTDSNIQVPYGYLEPVTSEDETFKLPAKDKLVCWIVSYWSEKATRFKFYNELKKHIKVHTYGGVFGQRISEQRYIEIVSSCKFYLSFENSVYKDYISEKVYRPMMLGTVPIAFGNERQQYETHIPPDSFIHFEDFSTPKELAERLFYLDQNQSEYMSYFSWRSRYKARRSMFGREHACRTCQYLKTHKEYQVVRNLDKWFWG